MSTLRAGVLTEVATVQCSPFFRGILDYILQTQSVEALPVHDITITSDSVVLINGAVISSEGELLANLRGFLAVTELNNVQQNYFWQQYHSTVTTYRSRGQS